MNGRCKEWAGVFLGAELVQATGLVVMVEVNHLKPLLEW